MSCSSRWSSAHTDFELGLGIFGPIIISRIFCRSYDDFNFFSFLRCPGRLFCFCLVQLREKCAPAKSNFGASSERGISRREFDVGWLQFGFIQRDRCPVAGAAHKLVSKKWLNGASEPEIIKLCFEAAKQLIASRFSNREAKTFTCSCR